MKPVLSLVAAGLLAGSAFASNINVTAKATANNASSITVAPGAAVPFRIEAQLSDTINDGLALLGFDLDWTGGDLAANTIVEPSGTPSCANPMPNFVKNLGITNPAGYKGTLIAGNLVQVGGGQNTIKNTADNADFPVGTVIANIAQGGAQGCPPNGPAIVATGSLTAPMAVGTYTLQIQNVFANVIRDGETGAVFFATEAAGVGTVTNLTVIVEATCQATSVTTAVPANNGSLPRTTKNSIFLTMSPTAVAPNPGEILVQELLPGGAFGSDLSANFTFTVEPGNILKVKNNTNTLQHRKWYTIRNIGDDCITNFRFDFVVQMGDASGDGQVNFTDMANINAGIPTIGAPDSNRRDINADGNVNFTDLANTNPRIPSAAVAKPSGH